jgi:UDP-glucose 4-epimerase
VTGAFNIGTGIETDVNELYAILARAAGMAAEAEHAGARAGEQRRSCIDPSAAARALGWKAEVPLEDGLRRTLEFFRRR